MRVQYISDNGLTELSKYKYAGADHSLLYKYLLKPIAGFLANRLPKNIHPNAITVTGLALCCATVAIFSYYSPHMVETGPTWIYVIGGVFLFMYQTLDNMDGHQARRTGLASPLGQLMDHGCDALNATVSALPLAAALQLGYQKGFLLVVATWLPFWFTTWEEYHTHYLYLPPINGPSEGLVTTVGLYFVTAIAGPEIWTKSISDDLVVADLILLLTSVLSVLTLCVSIVRVLRKIRAEPENSVGGLTALSQLIPFFWLTGWTVANCYVDHTPEKYPWIFFVSTGFMFSNLVCQLILSYLTKEAYPLFHLILVFPPLIFLNHYVEAFTDLRVLLVLYAFVAFFSFFHYAYHVTREICAFLKINAFTVPSDPILMASRP